MFGPRVSPFENADHIFWLLSAKSEWLPKEIHACLLEGMADDLSWTWGYYGTDKCGDWETNGELQESLFKAIGKKAFRFNKKSKNDLENRINSAITELQLPENASQLIERFTNLNFPQRWLLAQQSLKKSQPRNKKNRLILTLKKFSLLLCFNTSQFFFIRKVYHILSKSEFVILHKS